MKRHIETDRLALNMISIDDAPFMQILVNSPGWIRFIGDRKIKTLEDARVYVNNIINNPNILYWMISLKASQELVGVVTLIKRDYLDFHDIGFALLPDAERKGYAFEAARCILNEIISNTAHETILATTLPDNAGSIRLLQKLEMRLQEEIINDGDKLLVYAVKTKLIC